MAAGSMTAEDRAAAGAIMAEADAWRRIMALDGARTLKVFVDIKSPHAYLAVRPTLMVAYDYRVRIDFLPYNLSYRALGVTTSEDADRVRRPADAAADRRARMYYTAARQYAALQRLPLRTPRKLLETTAANKAMLFAKRQNVAVPFIMHVYVHGWGSGWRDYDVGSHAQLRASLDAVGADTAGFEPYMATDGAGDTELQACQDEAESTGIAGVPHYVFEDDVLGRAIGLFGREHLALIRGKFHAASLARRSDVTPEFSHAWQGPVAPPA